MFYRLMRLLAKWPIRKIIITTICLSLLLFLYNIKEISSLWGDYKNKHRYVVTQDEVNISGASRKEIDKYTDNFGAEATDDIQLVLVYKFIPAGVTYLYQGRALIAYHSRLVDTRTFLYESDITWMPLWIGRNAMEYVLAGKTVNYLLSVGEDGVGRVQYEGSNTYDSIPAVNMKILLAEGLQSVQLIPIKNEGQVIGYMSVYSKGPHADFAKIGDQFAARISRYMVE